MALPKRKTSKSRRDKRRTHKKIQAPNLSTCEQCGEAKLPHQFGHRELRKVADAFQPQEHEARNDLRFEQIALAAHHAWGLQSLRRHPGVAVICDLLQTTTALVELSMRHKSTEGCRPL